MTNELIERLAAHLYCDYSIAGDDLAEYLDRAEEILSELDLAQCISPDAIQARLADLDQGETRVRQLLAESEQKVQVCLQTLAQIQGGRQVLKALVEGKGE